MIVLFVLRVVRRAARIPDPDVDAPRRSLRAGRARSSSFCRCNTISIWIEWYGLYSIFIPVYVFLLLPIVAALRGDTTNFMRRVAAVQWGLMICVFCVSHVPALLTLDIPGYEGRHLLLIAFLVLVVQSSDVLQYVWGKLLRAPQDRAAALALQDRGRLHRRRR